jgi:glycosyltransferase involved in cell wall biosynthesis
VRPAVLCANNYQHVRGGSDRYYLEHARLLAARGHRVLQLATRHPAGETPHGPHRLLAPTELARPALGDVARFHFSRRARRAVRELLAEAGGPSVAHLHIYHGQLTASILAPLRAAGVPIVQTLHEYKLFCPVSTCVSRGEVCEACGAGSFWRAAARRCNRGSLTRSLVSASESYLSRALGTLDGIDHFLAPSRFLRARMLAHGLAPERITTLPYFVDTTRAAPSTQRGGYFLYAGRLERLKGVLTLVRAAARVPEVPLHLAGEGEARPELEALLRQPAYRHVVLRGHLAGAELARELAGARCLVQPSEWYENLPLSVLEALAAGRAVIASSSGGLPELVADGDNGLLFPAGDEEALATKLRFAADCPDELSRMGARGRERAESEFAPERHYTALVALYERLLAARS